MRLILPDDFENSAPYQLGGKGARLLQMKKAGLNVPEFFVIPAETVDRIIEPVRSNIEGLLANIRTAGDPRLFDCSQKIKEYILSTAMDGDLQEALLQSCAHLYGADYFVAVRSSAASEDGVEASFAGQHESFLFVRSDTLIERVRACIASAWSYGALSYRLAKGISTQDIKYAVVIQQMIDAEKSGVGFSMDVHGNLADMVAVAGYGLGEGIVQDRVETDTYKIDRRQRSVQKKCVAKHVQIRYSPAEGDLSEAPVDPALSDAPVLSEAEVLQVFDQAMKAERLLRFPSDVEFSFDSAGRLFLLQMRPITALDMREVEILDNTNIVESYPGITLPLSFSFALDAYEKVFKGCSKAFWISDKLIRENDPVFQNLLAHYYGRVYYRLDNWYKMLAMAHGSARSMSAWEKAVGLTTSESDKVTFTFQNKIKIFFSLVYIVFNYRRWNRKFFTLFDKNYIYLKDIKPQLHSPKALWRHYESATAELFKPWYITLLNDFLAFKFFGRLQDLISTFHLPTTASAANDLLCGIGGVESEEAVINVLRLKEKILSEPGLKALFEQPDEAILSQLAGGSFPDFNDMLQHHLARYGDRTLAELKLETPSLRSRPVLFIQLLKNQLSTPIKAKDFARRQEAIRTQAEAAIYSRLKWWNPQFYVFKLVRGMAAYGLKNRENMRFCRARAYGAVKDIFLEIGKMMASAGAIDSAEDVFYLSLGDLKDFCKNGVTDPKSAHIASIKSQYRHFESIHLPDHIIYRQGALPVMTNDMDWDTTKSARVRGIAVSKGVVEAPAAVVLNPEPHLSVHGKILVSKMTDPGWVFLMMQAAGLASEKGSLLSHTAIVGRELGIPVVVGLKDATSIFKNGDILKLDGSMGTVEIL